MSEIGALRQLGIGKESTRGTTVTPTFWIPTDSLTFQPEMTYTDDPSSVGRIERPTDSFVTTENGVVEFSATMRTDWIGLLLTAVFGQSPSTATASGESTVYEHDYTVSNDNDHASLTVAQKDGITAEKMAFGMVESMTISANADGLVTVEATIMGQKIESSSESPSFNADHVLSGIHGTIKQASDISSLGGANAINFNSVSLTINKNLRRHQVLGSKESNEIINQNFTIEGELELLHDDNSQRDLNKDGTQKAMRIDFNDSNTTIGSAETPQLQIDLARVNFTDWSISDAADEVQVETISFNARYDQDESTPQMITATLTNENDGTNY